MKDPTAGSSSHGSRPTACHPAAGTNCSVPVADYCTSPVSIGLLQQRLVRTSRQPHPASSVGPERCCTAKFPYPTVWAYHCRSHQPSLAACPRTHLIQTGCSDLPIHPRHFTRVADMTSRRRLRSSTSDRLYVPAVRLSTVGRRAFPVSGANIWNDLPTHVTSPQSLKVFRQRLKTFLFTRSYPNIIIWLFWHSPWTLQYLTCYLGHVKNAAADDDRVREERMCVDIDVTTMLEEARVATFV